MSRQCIKLVGERQGCGAFDCALAFANHVHEFDAGQDVSGGPKGFEAKHRSGHALDGAMVLLDDVVEILDLANDDAVFQPVIDVIDGRLVGAALVHRDLFRRAVLTHGHVEKAIGGGLVALGGQQEIDRLACLVHRAVQIFFKSSTLPGYFDSCAQCDKAVPPVCGLGSTWPVRRNCMNSFLRITLSNALLHPSILTLTKIS